MKTQTKKEQKQVVAIQIPLTHHKYGSTGHHAIDLQLHTFFRNPST